MRSVINGIEWVTRPLIDVATLHRGYDLPVQDREDGLHPIFAANGPVGFHGSPKCKGPGVVTGRSGTIGKVHFIESDYWPLNTSLYVSDFHGNDPKWVYYMLQSFGLGRYSQGAGVPTLNRNLVHGVPVKVPPLAQQRRIAAILDQAETLRAQRRAALAQLDSLTQSIFLDMFGDPATNSKQWPRNTLKELGRVSTGGTPPSAKDGMFDGPIPFVTPGDLDSDMPVRRSLTHAGAAEVGTVRAGATLVCCIGATIGKTGRARIRSAVNQQLNAVEWGPDVTDGYGFEVIRFFKPTIVSWGASTTLPILKKSSFERIEIPVPPIQLQKEFSSRIDAIQELKAVQRQSLMKLDGLFIALQSSAFNGEL